MGLSVKATLTCNLGCRHCLRAGTMILMADASWHPIEDVRVGDLVMGFDEHPDSSGVRRFRAAEVTKFHSLTGFWREIETACGRKLGVTDGHPILGRRDYSAGPVHLEEGAYFDTFPWGWTTDTSRGFEWIKAESLRPGRGFCGEDDLYSAYERGDMIMTIGQFDLPSPGSPVASFSEVQRVGEYEEGPVYNLETTTSTYVADGILVHNCYENEARTAGNAVRYYDLEAMRASIVSEMKRRRQTPVFHGGEPLLMPLDDMRSLCETMRATAEEEGFSPQFSIQTNALLVDEGRIALFKEYRFSVGVSIDGPGRLNRMREYRKDPDETDSATARIIENIRRLRSEGIHVGLITVVHRMNGLPEHREVLKSFYRDMKAIGIRDIRTNEMILDDPEMQEMCLTDEEMAEFFCDMADFTFAEGMNIQPYRDAVDLLLGMRTGTCIFGAGSHGCDPLNTRGEEVVYGDGSEVNCQKTSKDGTQPLRMEDNGTERSAILRAIPMAEGGCGGCPWWGACGGGCPSEGSGGDWRAKTRYCKSWQALFSHVERKLKGLLPNLITLSEYEIDGDPDYETLWGHGTEIAFARMRRRENRQGGRSLGDSTWATQGTWNPVKLPGFHVKRDGFWDATRLGRLRNNGYRGTGEPPVFGMIKDSLAGLPTRPVILELGCGDGLLLEYLSHHTGGASVAGVEMRERLIRDAARWQPEGTWQWGDVRLSRLWPVNERGWDAVIVWPQYFGSVEEALACIASQASGFASPTSLVVLAAQNDHAVRLLPGDGPQVLRMPLSEVMAGV